MSKEFSLLDEPWLPVRLSDGRVLELGLLEVFARSSEIVALAETAPPSLVAEYRLLLAITHRALVTAFGSWREKDRARWYREGLPLDEIRDYLEQWRERFWLFHPEHPFMQVAALATAEGTRDKLKPWTQIALASANGNTPVVFDHAYDAEPVAISPAIAIGTLLGFLQFTPGGLVRVIRDRDEGGALDNTAAVIPVGQNLAKTLALCLHSPPTKSSEQQEDLPAWEKGAPRIADLRSSGVLATGPNDRYTRLTRAVMLLPEKGNVRWLLFSVGLTLGKDPNAPDPMACFRAGVNGLVRLRFSDGRALWRDLPALVPTPSKDTQPAAVLNHAIALHQELNHFETAYQPILVAGVTSEVVKMKVLRWRMEQIVLPAPLLLIPDKALELREYVTKAEVLFSSMRLLAKSLLIDLLPKIQRSEADACAGKQLESSGFSVSYFAEAERALPELLRLIGLGQPEQAEALWCEVLRHAAQVAWDRLLAGIGSSPRALRADARYWPRFHGLLNKQVPLSDITVTDKEAAS